MLMCCSAPRPAAALGRRRQLPRVAATGSCVSLSPTGRRSRRPTSARCAELRCADGRSPCARWVQETAAIILEPVLGEGGFQTPPPGMLRALRDLCDEHGILLIFDEVSQDTIPPSGPCPLSSSPGLIPTRPRVLPGSHPHFGNLLRTGSSTPLGPPHRAGSCCSPLSGRPPAPFGAPLPQVQAGMGRTGKWWSHQLLGDVQPDMMLFAKGIASGFPFAGIASRPELYDKMVPGMMGKAPAAPAAWQGALPGLPALPCDAQPPL